MTCVLFGAGAGALILERSDCPGDRGILSTSLHSDGTYCHILETTGGVSTTGESGVISMRGREVFKHAVEKMAEGVLEALSSNQLTCDDLDWFVPHQANKRIMIAVAERLGIPLEKIIMTIGEHSNTSAASIPLALWEASQKKNIKEGDVVVLEALGGGLTWGSAVIRW